MGIQTAIGSKGFVTPLHSNEAAGLFALAATETRRASFTRLGVLARAG